MDRNPASLQVGVLGEVVMNESLGAFQKISLQNNLEKVGVFGGNTYEGKNVPCKVVVTKAEKELSFKIVSGDGTVYKEMKMYSGHGYEHFLADSVAPAYFESWSDPGLLPLVGNRELRQCG